MAILSCLGAWRERKGGRGRGGRERERRRIGERGKIDTRRD